MTTHFSGPVESVGGFVGNLVGNVNGELGSAKLSTQNLSANGAITVQNGLVAITKATACAGTLADPVATVDDGKMLIIVATTAAAHTISNTTGFNGAGASGDLATFGGAIGDGLVLIAYQGKWYIVNSINITLS